MWTVAIGLVQCVSWHAYAADIGILALHAVRNIACDTHVIELGGETWTYAGSISKNVGVRANAAFVIHEIEIICA